MLRYRSHRSRRRRPFPRPSPFLLSTPETHSPSAVSNFPSVTFPRPSFVYSPVYRRLYSKDTDGTSLSTIARIFDPRNEQMDTVGKSISTSPKFARIEKKNYFFIFQDYKVSRLQAFLSKRVRNEIDGWIKRDTIVGRGWTNVQYFTDTVYTRVGQRLAEAFRG